MTTTAGAWEVYNDDSDGQFGTNKLQFAVDEISSLNTNLQFDFAAQDDWDDEDLILVLKGGVEVNLGTFGGSAVADATWYDATSEAKITRTFVDPSTYGGANFGGSWTDHVYQYQISLPTKKFKTSGGKILFEFETTLDEALYNESAVVTNLTTTAMAWEVYSDDPGGQFAATEEKSFSTAIPSTYVTDIEFDFAAQDDWNDEDLILVLKGGIEVNLGTFGGSAVENDTWYDASSDVRITRTFVDPLTYGNANFGGSALDHVYRFQVSVSNEKFGTSDGNLNFTFKTTLNEELSNESAVITNLSVSDPYPNLQGKWTYLVPHQITGANPGEGPTLKANLVREYIDNDTSKSFEINSIGLSGEVMRFELHAVDDALNASNKLYFTLNNVRYDLDLLVPGGEDLIKRTTTNSVEYTAERTYDGPQETSHQSFNYGYAYLKDTKIEYTVRLPSNIFADASSRDNFNVTFGLETGGSITENALVNPIVDFNTLGILDGENFTLIDGDVNNLVAHNLTKTVQLDYLDSVNMYKNLLTMTFEAVCYDGYDPDISDFFKLKIGGHYLGLYETQRLINLNDVNSVSNVSINHNRLAAVYKIPLSHDATYDYGNTSATASEETKYRYVVRTTPAFMSELMSDGTPPLATFMSRNSEGRITISNFETNYQMIVAEYLIDIPSHAKLQQLWNMDETFEIQFTAVHYGSYNTGVEIRLGNTYLPFIGYKDGAWAKRKIIGSAGDGGTIIKYTIRFDEGFDFPAYSTDVALKISASQVFDHVEISNFSALFWEVEWENVDPVPSEKLLDDIHHLMWYEPIILSTDSLPETYIKFKNQLASKGATYAAVKDYWASDKLVIDTYGPNSFKNALVNLNDLYDNLELHSGQWVNELWKRAEHSYYEELTEYNAATTLINLAGFVSLLGIGYSSYSGGISLTTFMDVMSASLSLTATGMIRQGVDWGDWNDEFDKGLRAAHGDDYLGMDSFVDILSVFSDQVDSNLASDSSNTDWVDIRYAIEEMQEETEDLLALSRDVAINTTLIGIMDELQSLANGESDEWLEDREKALNVFLDAGLEVCMGHMGTSRAYKSALFLLRATDHMDDFITHTKNGSEIWQQRGVAILHDQLRDGDNDENEVLVYNQRKGDFTIMEMSDFRLGHENSLPNYNIEWYYDDWQRLTHIYDFSSPLGPEW